MISYIIDLYVQVKVNFATRIFFNLQSQMKEEIKESELLIADHLECLPFSKRFNTLLSEITFFRFIVN